MPEKVASPSHPPADRTASRCNPPTPLESFGWLLSEKIVRAAGAIAVTGAVARHLGPTEFGILSLAASVTIILLPLASLSAETVVIRELVRHPDREREIILTATALRAMAGAALLGLTLTAVLLAPPAREHLKLTGLIGLAMIWQAAETPETWFRRHLRARFTAIARFGAFASTAAVKLGLVAAGAGAEAFACAYAAEGLVYGIALLAGYRAARMGVSRADIDFRLARDLLRECAGPAFAATLAGFALKLDQLMVMIQLGAAEAGKYAAACRFTDFHFFVATALGVTLYPKLAECRSGAREDFTLHLERHFELMLLAGWSSAAVVAVASTATLPLLFGGAYGDALPAVWIQSAGALLFFSGIARSHHAMLTGAGWTLLASAVATLLAQAGFAWWLTPSYGITGAAMAQGLAAITGGWLMTAVLRPLRPVFLHQTRAFLILFRPWRWKAALRLAL